MTDGKGYTHSEVYEAEAFIAAITQHIPQKSFPMVRYYGWYSNRSRGMRLKAGIQRPGDPTPEVSAKVVEIIGASPLMMDGLPR